MPVGSGQPSGLLHRSPPKPQRGHTLSASSHRVRVPLPVAPSPALGSFSARPPRATSPLPLTPSPVTSPHPPLAYTSSSVVSISPDRFGAAAPALTTSDGHGVGRVCPLCRGRAGVPAGRSLRGAAQPRLPAATRGGGGVLPLPVATLRPSLLRRPTLPSHGR